MAITLLTLKEAAERYGLAVEQLREHVRDGRISLVAMDGQKMVSDDEVRKVAGGNGNHVHWIALKDAARQYALEEALLERLAREGLVRSGMLADELHLAVEDVEPIAARLKKSNFEHLESHPIEAPRAAKKYNLPYGSLLNWTRQGYIRRVGSRKRPVLLNEADVAYTSALAVVCGISQGKALFPTSKQYSPAPAPWLRQ